MTIERHMRRAFLSSKQRQTSRSKKSAAINPSQEVVERGARRRPGPCGLTNGMMMHTDFDFLPPALKKEELLCAAWRSR